jgi:hypothetical protein
MGTPRPVVKHDPIAAMFAQLSDSLHEHMVSKLELMSYCQIPPSIWHFAILRPE